MKILHVIPYFQPEYGYEDYFHAVEQYRLGHDVYVATSKFYNPMIKNGKRIEIKTDPSKEKINVIRLPSLEIPRCCQNILFGLNKLIRKLKPDLLYVHGPDNTSSFQVLLAQLQLKLPCKYVIDVHSDGTDLSDVKNQSLIKRFKRGYKYLIGKMQMRKSDKIIFFAQDEKNIFTRRYHLDAKKTIAVPMGVSTIRFVFNEFDRIEVREHYNITSDEFVGIISGRITREKKHDELIRAIGTINKSIRLLVVGDINAEYKLYLEKVASMNGLSKESIIFVGEIKNCDLSKFFCAADVGFWVSNYSVGILEAYACNLPVILCREATGYYPALDESLIVLNGCFSDAVKIADILRQDKDLLSKLRKTAREIAVNCSYAKMANSILSSIY